MEQKQEISRVMANHGLMLFHIITTAAQCLRGWDETGGANFYLGVDTNNAITYPEALCRGWPLEANGVEFLEEAVPRTTLKLSARLARDRDVASEPETNLYAMRDLMVAGAEVSRMD